MIYMSDIYPMYVLYIPEQLFIYVLYIPEQLFELFELLQLRNYTFALMYICLPHMYFVLVTVK